MGSRVSSGTFGPVFGAGAIPATIEGGVGPVGPQKNLVVPSRLLPLSEPRAWGFVRLSSGTVLVVALETCKFRFARSVMLSARGLLLPLSATVLEAERECFLLPVVRFDLAASNIS